MMKKRFIQATIALLGVAAIVMTALYTKPSNIKIEEEPVALSDSGGNVVSETNADRNVMPDKYNTGASGTLIEVGMGDKVNGIQFVPGNNSKVNALDFPKRNAGISGTVIFENYDFSSYPLWTYREDKIEQAIHVVFNNCKFSQIATGKTEAKISYEFNHCTINSFKGSNATFNRCMFGKSYSDGIVPFVNVSVNDCFFCDMASSSESGAGLHTDGTQIYGYADVDVTNVSYTNCRFEVPAISTEGNTAIINACIMLQLEYSNANNLSFTNCTVNGGGYSIYARDKGKGFTFDNVKFQNIQVGCTKLYGTFYPIISPGIDFENILETQNLYVGSVWKKNGETHFSVTNDTAFDHTLMIYADGELYDYEIPACPSGGVYLESYESYPFDMDIVVPADCKYAVCYDVTEAGLVEQIRFVNWTDDSVILDETMGATLKQFSATGDEYLLSGQCGKNITYTLSKSGVLTLTGTGATYSYNSSKLPPWAEYKASIKKIVIGEGITDIGTQIFKDCSCVSSVVFPEGLTTIYSRAFMGASCLTEISLPSTLKEVGDNAFWGSIIQKVYFAGTNQQWSQVRVGNNNTMITNSVMMQEMEENSVVSESASALEGECGKAITFTLSEDGVLTLKGEGVTYNYNSSKHAPWYDDRESITAIVIEEGITQIGSQLFAQCSNLTTVELPSTLEVIGANAFIKCRQLAEITIPKGVCEIQKYAFASTGLQQTYYEGSKEAWQQIVIGVSNDLLQNNICYGE